MKAWEISSADPNGAAIVDAMNAEQLDEPRIHS